MSTLRPFLPTAMSIGGGKTSSNSFYKRLLIILVVGGVLLATMKYRETSLKQSQMNQTEARMNHNEAKSGKETSSPSATSECAVFYSAKTKAYPKQLHFGGKQRRRLPQALIIGVRKCGTRALLDMLSLNPFVCQKYTEMHFFEKFYNKGLEWYRGEMPYSFDEQITMEKSPAYFTSPEVPARVKKMNESIRLLVIVREPATRVVSDYLETIEENRIEGKPIIGPFEEEVLTQAGKVNDGAWLVKKSQYSLHLSQWLKYFKLHQMHFVDGDKLITNPFAEIDKVQKFLQLPQLITAENFYFDQKKGFYCMRNEIFNQCLGDGKGRPHPHVDPAIMSRLRRFFAPFNERFYKMVGQNFHWPTA